MPSGTTAPVASRPFQRAWTRPRRCSPVAIVTSCTPTRIAIRSRSALRMVNSMFAACETHSQTGEKSLSTCVCEIGLGSSFRRCVTTKAVAVAVSKTSTRTVGAFRLTDARFYVAATDRQPHEERNETEAKPDGDHVARVRHVDQLDPAQRENAGEPEPQCGLRESQREAARDPDTGHRPKQQPRHRVQIDVALHQVADARDP